MAAGSRLRGLSWNGDKENVMAITVTKVDVWAADIEDKVGTLDKVLEAIATAGGNVECVIARRHPGKAGMSQVFVSPVKGAKVIKAAKAVGLAPAADMGTLRVESGNKVGEGHKVMAAIAAAGINVRGISVVGMGNKGVAYIGFDSKADADKAMKAVKGVGK